MKIFPNHMPICLLLLLGFLLFPLPSSKNALAEGIWTFDNNVDSLTAYQDGILLLEGGQLWFWTPDQKEPQKMGDAIYGGIQALFTDDDGQLLALEGYNGYTRLLRGMVNGQSLSMKEVCTLTLPDTENHYAYSAFYQQNTVYTLLLNRQTGQKTLYVYDTVSQQEWTWNNFPNQRIAPYHDRLILGTQTDAEMVESLVILDVTTQKATIISPLPGAVELLAYDKLKDQVAYLRRPVVYMGFTEGEKVEQGYLPITSYYSDKGALTSNGYFAMADDNRLLYTKLDTGFLNASSSFLTISDAGLEMDATRLFRLDHPEIPVMTRSASYKLADVAQAIRSNDTETDIFVVRTAYPGYVSLLSKGFCADLSSDSSLMALAQSMPEALQKGLIYDGKLLAFPLEISFGGTSFSYSKEALEAMGVTEDVMPDNLSDFLSLLIEWYETGKMDGVRLLGYKEPENQFIRFLVYYFTDYYEATQDEPLHYTSELFYELMEKTDRIIQLMKMHPQTSDPLPVLLQGTGLDSQFMKYDIDTDRVFFSLVPKKGMPLRFTASMKVCIVNPLSQKLTQAMAYLRSLKKNMDHFHRLSLRPDTAVPIENPFYAKTYLETSEMIAQLEDDKRKAPAEDQKEYLGMLQEYQSELASIEQRRWDLSQETIDAYRIYAPNVYFYNDFVTTMMEGSELDAALRRYVAGHMDWNQLILELEERLEKIKKE